jgi:hypothetical protein
MVIIAYIVSSTKDILSNLYNILIIYIYKYIKGFKALDLSKILINLGSPIPRSIF